MRPKVHRGYENREDVASPQAIKKIYFHSIAASINKNCSDHVKKIRTPRDNLANRLAVEYVANFIRKHQMINAQEIGFLESGQYLQESHDTNWIARRLGLLTTRPIYSQLIDVLGRDPDYQSTIDEELVKNSKLPPPKQRTRTQSTAPDVSPEDCLQSSDGCFTSFMTTGVPEDSYASRSPRNREHHRHHHRKGERSQRSHSRDYMIPDEPTITFTQLETQEEQNRYLKSTNQRHKSSRHESSKKDSEKTKPERREHSKRFVQQPQTDTYVDTYIPEKKATTVPSTKTITVEEKPKPKGTFLERFAALMIPNKYSNYEVQTNRVDQYPTLATSDFREEEPNSETLSVTGERFENTNNVLAAFLDKMEGPERKPIAPARDETYRVADLQATVSVTDTQTAARAESSERLPLPPSDEAPEEPLLKPRSSVSSRSHSRTHTKTHTGTHTHTSTGTHTHTHTGTHTKTNDEEITTSKSSKSHKSTKTATTATTADETKTETKTNTKTEETETKTEETETGTATKSTSGKETEKKEEKKDNVIENQKEKRETKTQSSTYTDSEESYSETDTKSSLGSLKKPEPVTEPTSSSSSSYEYEEEEEEEEVVEVIEESDSSSDEKKPKAKVIIIEEEEDEEEEVVEEIQEVVVEED